MFYQYFTLEEWQQWRYIDRPGQRTPLRAGEVARWLSEGAT